MPPTPRVLSRLGGPDEITRVDRVGISRAPIQGRLMWLPVRRGQVELVWNFLIETEDGDHAYDFTVSASGDGQVWTRFDQVDQDSYTVYLLIEAADASNASLVEAAIDDVSIEKIDQN